MFAIQIQHIGKYISKNKFCDHYFHTVKNNCTSRNFYSILDTLRKLMELKVMELKVMEPYFENVSIINRKGPINFRI